MKMGAPCLAMSFPGPGGKFGHRVSFGCSGERHAGRANEVLSRREWIARINHPVDVSPQYQTSPATADAPRKSPIQPYTAANLELRAVHDGTNVYVLARWNDQSLNPDRQRWLFNGSTDPLEPGESATGWTS